MGSPKPRVERSDPSSRALPPTRAESTNQHNRKDTDTMQNSLISWTDHTFNGWVGCTRVDDECDVCYAADIDQKYGHTSEGWGHGKPRHLCSDASWDAPLKWNADAARVRRRLRVFASSMADVFDAEVPVEWRARLFDLITKTPWLDWQLLTKRPNQIERQLKEIGYWDRLPLPNVWLGFSAGRQRYFDQRWPIIREIPAHVRFCSYEPALELIKLGEDTRANLHWLIAGGETNGRKGSGRPMDPEWARSVRDQCSEFGIAFWFKQTGNWLTHADATVQWHGKSSRFYREHFDLLDGVRLQQMPMTNP